MHWIQIHWTDGRWEATMKHFEAFLFRKKKVYFYISRAKSIPSSRHTIHLYIKSIPDLYTQMHFLKKMRVTFFPKIYNDQCTRPAVNKASSKRALYNFSKWSSIASDQTKCLSSQRAWVFCFIKRILYLKQCTRGCKQLLKVRFDFRLSISGNSKFKNRTNWI